MARTTDTVKEDRRLAKLTKICLSFPEARREVCGLHAAFAIGKRTFAWFLNDHHGDGIVGVTCKVIAGDGARLVAADPGRFYLPAYCGARGWVGLRLDTAGVDWEEVAELVAGSYRMMAPKRLLALCGKV